MTTTARAIRPMAIGLLWKGERLLVQHGYDADSRCSYWRPPGGGIEFGETASEALQREFEEEFGARIETPRLIDVLENRFVYAGERHHEIVFVFATAFADPERYAKEQFVIRETTLTALASWEDPHDDATPLYPTGLRELLARR